MDALVVVHAEMSYLDDLSIESYRQLFDKIALEMGTFFEQGDKVYWLADDNDPIRSKLFYPAFVPYFSNPNTVYIPSLGSFAEQCLITKQWMIRDGIQKSYISGLARMLCVDQVYHFLLGEYGPEFTKDYLERIREELNWSARSFDRIFSMKIEAYVRDDLVR